MRKYFFPTFCLWMLTCAAWAQVNSYYISPNGNDSNDGSAARPWRTITHADSAIRLGPSGTVVHVAPGTYSCATNCQGTELKTFSQGTATQRITWISDTPLAAIINGGWAIGNNGSTPGGDYTTIQGFTVTAPNADEGIGIGIIPPHGGGNFAQVLNNYVHDVGTYGSYNTECAHDGAIAVNATTHDVLVDGNRVNRAGLYGGCASGTGGTSDHGIYIAGYHNTVTNNLVSNVAGDGIHMYHNPCQNVVSNNTVFHNFTGGMQFGAAGDGDPGPCSGIDDYNSVNNNIVVRNGWGCCGNAVNSTHGSWGINFYGGTGSHSKAFNNYLAANFDGSGNPTNNTINAAGGGIVPTLGGNTASTTHTGLFINYQDDGSGDYHLAIGSAPIDSGTTTSSTVCASAGPSVCVPTRDYAGLLRGIPPSIGAHEFGTIANTSPDAPTNLTATVQ